MKKLTLSIMAALLITACSDDDGNTVPQVISEDFVTQADTPFTEMLTASDEDGDALTYTLDESPTLGTVDLTSNGEFTYSPNTEVTGEDSFTFTVSDGVTVPVTGTIGITIEAKQVAVSTYVRSAFTQSPIDEPLPINGRAFSEDSDDPNAFDDLLGND